MRPAQESFRVGLGNDPRPFRNARHRQVWIAGADLEKRAPARSMPVQRQGGRIGPIPLITVTVRMRGPAMKGRQGIGCPAGNPDHAEFVEPEGRRDVLDVADGIQRARALGELRGTHTGPVRSDDPEPLLPARSAIYDAW